MEEGTIRHVLAIAMPGRMLRRGPVWPATEQDANAPSSYTGAIPIGTLIAIPPQVNVDAMFLSEEGAVVARALQDYGAYVVDQASVMTLYAEPSVEPAVVEAIRADLARIRRELRVVTNNTAERPGGGGRPRAPIAAPLAVP